MTAYLLAGPAQEPVSLADAKAFLRLDDSAEDALVTTLITAARLHVEGTTARAMIAQSWRLVRDAWPLDREVRLPVGPLLTLSAMTAFDEEGEPTELELAQFEIEAATPRLLLPPEIEGMPQLRERQGIEIDYVAGYGADAGDVPADLKHALLVLVAYWFENRDAVIVAGSGGVLPQGFDRLVAPYRQVRL
jgi:uncharacterized phiE125 gp8 family phage protein